MLGGLGATVLSTMRSPLRVSTLLACAGALLASSAAAAQEQAVTESVVLLAPPEVRAEWTAALQLELAARGAIAIPAELPEVATTLLGDAEAQRVAIARGASAAVWVEARPDAWRLRMLSATAERARVVPVARDADARTVALILVSLLDGAAEVSVPEPPAAAQPVALPPAAPAPVVVPEAPPPVVLGVAALDAPEEEVYGREDEEVRPRRGEPYVHWAGLVGVGGLALAQSIRVQLGIALRAGIGMRYDWFEAAILHDLGLYFEHASSGGVQPLGRGCLEVGAATPRTTAAFHAGVRGCLGSVFAVETQRDFGGGEIFISNGARAHLSGGGYAAVSFALASWIRIFVRADVDVGWTDFALFDQVDVLPMLSSYLSFS